MGKDKITIIKIGSNVLVDEQGRVRSEVVENILSAVNDRIKQGEKILLVSSGAVAIGSAGNEKLNKKLAAGIGQMYLMSSYLQAAQKLNLQVSEILLSLPHLVEREQFLQLQESIQDAFANKIIPIVNENDTLVYGTDWGFPDNDTLASSLAIAFGADRLLILSHVSGLYTANPLEDSSAKLISEVIDVNAPLMEYCTKDKSEQGRGGMVTKLKAARLCTAIGIKTQIVNGLEKETINKALNGEQVGTVFLPRSLPVNIKNRQRWILAAHSSAASIVVDEGAVTALQAGKSLLAVGIKKIYGQFNQGEIVELMNSQQEGIAFGVVDIDSKKLDNYKEQKGVQVMHTDNIMVFV